MDEEEPEEPEWVEMPPLETNPAWGDPLGLRLPGGEQVMEPRSNPIIVNLEYPRLGGNADQIIIGLDDVRAADSIYVTYDFARDGWRIGMDRTADREGRIEVFAEDVETAFIPAWNTTPTETVDPS